MYLLVIYLNLKKKILSKYNKKKINKIQKKLAQFGNKLTNWKKNCLFIIANIKKEAKLINVRPRPELMGWLRLVVVVVERSLPDNIFITRILYLHLPQTLYMVSMFCFCVFQVECLSVKVLLVGCVGLFGGFSVVGGFSCSVCS